MPPFDIPVSLERHARCMGARPFRVCVGDVIGASSKPEMVIFADRTCVVTADFKTIELKYNKGIEIGLITEIFHTPLYAEYNRTDEYSGVQLQYAKLHVKFDEGDVDGVIRRRTRRFVEAMNRAQKLERNNAYWYTEGSGWPITLIYEIFVHLLKNAGRVVNYQNFETICAVNFYDGAQIKEMWEDVQRDSEVHVALGSLKPLMGWELECTELDIDTSQFEGNLNIISDGSVNGAGLELIPSPLSPVKSVALLLNVLENATYEIDGSCGLHFHISLNGTCTDSEKLVKNRKSRFINNLFALCKMNEKEIFKLVPESRFKHDYCRPLNTDKAGTVKAKLGRLSSSKYSNTKRYEWVNFTEAYRNGGMGSIEFRILGETSDESYIVAFVNLFLMLIKHSFSMRILSNPESLWIAQDEISNQLELIKKLYHHTLTTPQHVIELKKLAKLQIDLEGLSDNKRR